MSRNFAVVAVSLLVLFFTMYTANAQSQSQLAENGAHPGLQSAVGFGFGYSQLENEFGQTENYVSTTLTPEFSFGPVGVGLLANLRFNTQDGSVRKQDFDDVSDFIGIVRYVRYGQKGSPGAHVRFGSLSQTTIGYGQHVNLFANGISLDRPKRGLIADLNSGPISIETVYSNIQRPEVMGARLAAQPLYQQPFPLIKKLEIGVSLTADVSGSGATINATNPGEPFSFRTPSDSSGTANVGIGDGDLYLIGADIGMPVFSIPMAKIKAYATYSNILRYGSGSALGVQGLFGMASLAQVQARLEQRFNGSHYLASYFDAFYEIDRLRATRMPAPCSPDCTGAESVLYESKRNRLAGQSKAVTGTFGSVGGQVLGMVTLEGSYQHLWREADSGWLHLGAMVNTGGAASSAFARATYDRWNINGTGELLDYQSEFALLTGEAGFMPIRYLLVSIVYLQSFEPLILEGEDLGLVKRARVEPRVQIVIPF